MSAVYSTRPFRLGQGESQGRLPLQPDRSVSPTERHRPRQLAELVGQGEIVWRLEAFLDAPYSAAFFFEGETGTGKTSAALCLAAELGAVEFGGLDRINSGQTTGDVIANALRNLHYYPMMGSGWRVLVVDEADYMVYEQSKSLNLFLSALENLPPHSVVVFTTNVADKFPQRFLDRCERFSFKSDARTLAQDAQALVDRIWEADRRDGPPPSVAQLADAVDAKGRLSFRRVVNAASAFRPSAAPARLGVVS